MADTSRAAAATNTATGMGASAAACAPEHLAAEAAPARGFDPRWLRAILAGCALAIPLGILLSYVAFLMAFLGLFFYALFGLLIGATVCRAAGKGARLPRWQVVAGTTLIVLVGLGTSMKWEIDGLPHDMAKQAVDARQRLPEGMTKDAYMRHVETSVERSVEDRYPPGGALGYVRWVTQSGRFEKGSIEHVTKELTRGQRRWSWVIRVVLSVVLFSFGIASLTWTLVPRRSAASETLPAGSTLYG
ncbi:MAG: hypothetical protein IT449_11475 [Phycisphaerales bacterium]|nr:hypothetical protein [Phycisphaerales bacterium]